MNPTWKDIAKVVKQGNWMIRSDTDGQSHQGFNWAPQGEWTEAPDWTEEPLCKGGLFGQDRNVGGYMKRGNRLLFCETAGPHIAVDNNKVKVRRARILLINDLPAGLAFAGSLDLSGCTLPDGFTLGDVGGGLDLSGCKMSGCQTTREIRQAIRAKGKPAHA